MLSSLLLFTDVAQGNFSEEIVAQPDVPTRKEGPAAGKDQDPLRPELSSKLKDRVVL